MQSLPMCQPNGPVIKELIRKRGYTVSGFARMIRRSPAARSAGPPPSERSIRRAISSVPIRIEYIRPVARGLRVKPSEISDWTGDDDIWDDPEIKISA